MNLTYLPIFLGLAAVALLLQFKQRASGVSVPANQYAFKTFQRHYLIIYLLAMFADWLQGPYVYALYQEYGFDSADIGLLFVAGFGCSGFLGCFIGGLADVLGRRLTCICFCIVYGLSCVTKHFADFNILMLGRLLGGAATSILYSAFDAWLVYEHHHRKFDASWISQTFCRATFGNGIAAVLAGLLASYLAENFKTVTPFDASLIVLIICGLALTFLWSENYGTKPSENSVIGAMTDAVKIIFSDINVFFCGILQSSFEGAMYSFVFVWTPAFPPNTNLGLVFACFMVAIMIGSCIFAELQSMGFSLTCINIGLCVVSSISLLCSSLLIDTYPRLCTFLTFEVMCGIYFPAYYTLRSQIVPDNARATILNIYRIPLNAIVVTVCVTYGRITISEVFKLCSALLTLAAISGAVLHKHLIVANKSIETTGESVALKTTDVSADTTVSIAEDPVEA